MEALVGENNISFFEDLFETLDTDGSGELDLDEIELALKSTAEGTADAKFLMGITDINKSGAQEEKSQIEQLLDFFQKYDTNNDGELDMEEAYACMNAFSITKIGMKIIADESEFKEHFLTMDLDGNNMLNKPEFLIMYLGLNNKKGN